MKKILCGAMSIFLMAGLAEARPYDAQKLDRVKMVLSTEQWVTTTTAEVEVTINATLTQTSLVQMRQKILHNLNAIAKGEWHIIRFNRRQDASGLENLYVNATVRVEQSSLSGVYNQAKKVSIPGVQYKVTNIDFSPSFSDVKRVENSVRKALYAKVNQEVNELNSIYKDQHYSVHSLVFTDQANPTPQFEVAQYSQRTKNAFMAKSAPSMNIAVSNRVIMHAIVSIASNRKE